MKKRILSVLLAIAMVAVVLATGFAAMAAEDTTPALKVDIAATGETVKVSVSVLTASKVASGQFVLGYDEEKLEFVSGEQVDPALFNPASMICVYGQATAYAKDTEVLTAVFKVKSTPISAECVTLSGVENFTETYDEANEVTTAFTCDHSIATEKVITPAACEEAGSKEVTCSVCGNVATVAIPATGHSFGEWKVTKAATATEAGEEQRTCSVCDAVETRAIPALGEPTTNNKPATGDKTPTQDKPAAKPNAGDKSPATGATVGVSAVTVMAAAAVVTLLARKKKED